ncbi:MAG: hypothetical protein QM753_00050 [Thermomicrobiales bacterium]
MDETPDAQDALEQLRADIAEADAEFERGEYVEFTPDYFECLQDRVDQMIAQCIAFDPNVCP